MDIVTKGGDLCSRGFGVLAVDLLIDYVRVDVRNYRHVERIFDKIQFDSIYHIATIIYLFATRLIIQIFLSGLLKLKEQRGNNT